MQTFRKNHHGRSTTLLNHIITNTQQSRAILLIGQRGWGKTATGLDLAQQILQKNPLNSSDFFYFRNDLFSLKTTFFLTKKTATEEAWTWLMLLQRRINMIHTLDESLTLPLGIKLTPIKESLDEYLNNNQFPTDEKFINQLIQLTQVLDKKSGIPIGVIREAIKFHSSQANSGRVSVLSDFDKADSTTQNSTLKLIEEPFNNHWIILTAEEEKNIIPTILSRCLKINLQKPLINDLLFLGDNPEKEQSSVDIMKENVFQLSTLKSTYLIDFFTKCAPNIEYGITLFQFIEQLGKVNHSVLFLEELLKCMEDALIQRQNYIRQLSLPLHYPSYVAYSKLFTKISVAELEELVSLLDTTKEQVKRSVIKDDSILPSILLEVARTLRKVKS